MQSTNVSSDSHCQTCPTMLQYPQGATKMVGGSPSAEGLWPSDYIETRKGIRGKEGFCIWQCMRWWLFWHLCRVFSLLALQLADFLRKTKTTAISPARLAIVFWSTFAANRLSVAPFVCSIYHYLWCNARGKGLHRAALFLLQRYFSYRFSHSLELARLTKT